MGIGLLIRIIMGVLLVEGDDSRKERDGWNSHYESPHGVFSKSL